MIAGVALKSLVTHPDSRGFFREIMRGTDDIFAEGFGQFSHSLSYPGVLKAWHIHWQQVDWWYVPIGAITAALHDLRPDSPTFGQTDAYLLGEAYPAQVLRIPPGVAHGYRVIGGVTHLFYLTSRPYDPSDEGRISPADLLPGYWSS